MTNEGVAGDWLYVPIEKVPHGVDEPTPTKPVPPLLLLKMLLPAMVHGVLMVREVPPIKAPAVPVKVTPVPAVTEEVAVPTMVPAVFAKRI